MTYTTASEGSQYQTRKPLSTMNLILNNKTCRSAASDGSTGQSSAIEVEETKSIVSRSRILQLAIFESATSTTI